MSKDMSYKQELLPLAYNRARSIKAKIEELGITADTDVDELVIKLAKAKAEDSDKSWTNFLKGQEWYVKELIRKSKLDNKELLEECYQELLPANSSFDELVAMLAA